MYDAIVVGARCAGSPTAMLLAKRGYRVLLVDRATFPSDTISTHLLWPHGAEMMARWGLLDRLRATGLPAICREMTFDVGPFALRGTVPDANDGRGGYCPRRKVLDTILVRAAEEAGCDLREGFVVDELLRSGTSVVGIRGHDQTGGPYEDHARVVVGADGVHSLVATSVTAREYDTYPVAACAYYSYFHGVALSDVELYMREHCAFGGAPTNDELQLVMVNWPAEQFAEVRADIEGHFWRALDLAPDFAARVRAGQREDAWHGTAGVPGYFRTPYGEGWALVGDAAYNRDPITAQGISDAFLDADSIVNAIDAGLSARTTLPAALSAHGLARDERVRPMYHFTYQLARLEPPPKAMQRLFAGLHGNQDATNAFFSAITGAIPISEFMAEENIARITATAGTDR